MKIALEIELKSMHNPRTKLKGKLLSWTRSSLRARKLLSILRRKRPKGRNTEPARSPLHDAAVGFVGEPSDYSHVTNDKDVYQGEMTTDFQHTCSLAGSPPQEELPSAKDTITTLPSELLYKITTFMDDVGFVCFRNAHPRLRAMLSIDLLSISPSGKYIIRGIMGLHGVPSPVHHFCPHCTILSWHWMKYPDQKPSMDAIKRWRKHNVLAGMTVISVRRDGHFCEIGFKPERKRRKPSVETTPVLGETANCSLPSLAPIFQEHFAPNGVSDEPNSC